MSWPESKTTSTPTAATTTDRTISTSTTMLASDNVVMVNAINGPVVFTLLPAAGMKGVSLTIKKIDESENLVTVKGAGVDHIDMVNSQLLTMQFQALTLYCNGVEWFVRSSN